MYKYLDEKEKQLFKNANSIMNVAKANYKLNYVANANKRYLNKNTYYYPASKGHPIEVASRNKFDELNIVFLKDVCKHYYSAAIQEAEQLLDKKINKEYSEKLFGLLISSFIMGNGLNFVYDKELNRRFNYYNEQLIGILNFAANQKLSNYEKDNIITNLKNAIKKGVDSNQHEINNTVAIIKRNLMLFTDSMAVFIANKARLQAFIDSGITHFVRKGHDDHRTCDYCSENMGKILTAEEALKENIPSHYNCRCWLEPYIDQN